MRLRKLRLTAPIVALNPKRIANCHGRGASVAPVPPRQAAAKRNVTKLARFCTAASRARYLPRIEGGTRAVIHGSQAQLEMPLERLKPNSNANNTASRLLAPKNAPVKGTIAMPKMNITRVPQPAYTKRLNPSRGMWLAAGI